MITVNNLKLPLDYGENEIRAALSKLLGAKVTAFTIIKRAVDARNKNNVCFVYNIDVTVNTDEEKIVRKCKSKDIFISDRPKYVPPHTNASPDKKCIVVGSGPAGLFCAYLLALAGIEPVLIERGKSVDDRKASVELFKKTGLLDVNSNVQFGEGGAGTFSDGKLNTGIKDVRIRYVLETFAKMANGEADDILWMAKPHIGTDRLIKIVKNMRNEIISLGGKVLFEHTLVDIIAENNILRGIKVAHNGETFEMECDSLVLAIGHSARDTLQMLYERQVPMQQKPYAVGVRIEHKRELIDRSQYGRFAGYEKLGAADYKLACTPDGKRGVYSFCMCPGGYVMPAASEIGHLAVNGMSEYARDAQNSNAPLLVGVAPEDLHSENVLAGVELQRKIDKLAFELGGGSYKAPVELVGDLIEGIPSKNFGAVTPSYEPGVTPTDLRDCLPDFVIESIRAALPIFGKMIKGYDSYDAVLTGVESRSSSPVRINRDNETLQSDVKGIYPCGEGAGYAGGIVSAAVDGIKCAEKILEK